MHFVIFRIAATINTPVSFKGESFIRIGTYNKSLDQHPERERKIWTSANRAYEKLPSIINISIEEALTLIDYQGYFRMKEMPTPSSKDFIREKLIQDRILEQIEGQIAITNLGALLFARNINSFENISRKALRVIIYDGSDRTKTIKEQVGKFGFAIGFEGLIKFINELLPSKEIIGEALRKTIYMYPPIRELVANAIIHQDFNVSGTSSMVEIFDNRIEITNPGKPIIDPLRFVDHSPQSRNETLARFMRRLNICEERGSGIDKVIFECEFNQLPAPSFIVGENYTRVILYAPKPLRDMDKEDKIRACYQHACLKYVSGENMTNQTLRERLGVEDHNYSIVSRIISDTKEVDLTKDFDPSNKSRTYAKYLPFWA
jgi:ATP-dependent DNA helicase RecG